MLGRAAVRPVLSAARPIVRRQALSSAAFKQAATATSRSSSLSAPAPLASLTRVGAQRFASTQDSTDGSIEVSPRSSLESQGAAALRGDNRPIRSDRTRRVVEGVGRGVQRMVGHAQVDTDAGGSSRRSEQYAPSEVEGRGTGVYSNSTIRRCRRYTALTPTTPRR